MLRTPSLIICLIKSDRDVHKRQRVDFPAPLIPTIAAFSCSFNIEDHEKAAIVGINGAGKSTLLKIITGIEPADTGLVTLAKDKKMCIRDSVSPCQFSWYF